MKVFVTAKASAREDRVEKVGENQFRVWVKAPAHEGRANAAVMEALSKYLELPRSRFSLLSGHRSKSKIIEIADL